MIIVRSLFLTVLLWSKSTKTLHHNACSCHKEMTVILSLCVSSINAAPLWRTLSFEHGLTKKAPCLTFHGFVSLLNHFHSLNVCLLAHLSFSLSPSTGKLFTLPAVFTVHLLPHFLPPSIPAFISPQTLAFSPGSSGEGSNNYYVNKYACCNHIRATDPIRELIVGGWLRGLAADGQGLCACLTGRPR